LLIGNIYRGKVIELFAVLNFNLENSTRAFSAAFSWSVQGTDQLAIPSTAMAKNPWLQSASACLAPSVMPMGRSG
jgi:hypothetical protein